MDLIDQIERYAKRGLYLEILKNETGYRVTLRKRIARTYVILHTRYSTSLLFLLADVRRKIKV